MLRLTVLSVGLICLAAVSPLGCPTTDSTDDSTTRGTLETAATASTSLATAARTVTLQATATADASGGTISYAWMQIGGPGVQITNANQAEATFDAPSLETQQTLTFLVTTTNEAGAIGRAEVHVGVRADANYQPYDFGPDATTGGPTGAVGPTANAGEDQSVKVGETVTLDGKSSAGHGLEYRWSQVSGTSVSLSSTDTVQVTFAAPTYDPNGTNQLTFQLAVTDAENRTVTDRAIVDVRDPNARDRYVRVATTMGEFVVELNPEKAPISTANFLQYVDDQFYDGTIFHRVMAGFVIQGGGFLPGLTQKTTRDPIKNESTNGLKNVRRSVAMARTNDPDTATSQFYINLVDNAALDYTSRQNVGYAVFGKVIQGMNVVDRIAAVAVETQNGADGIAYENVPVTDVIIRSIRRE